MRKNIVTSEERAEQSNFGKDLDNRSPVCYTKLRYFV